MTTKTTRLLPSFRKLAAGKPAGTDLLPAARRIKNHHGNTGVAEGTMRRWEAAQAWVTLLIKAEGRKRTIVGMILTEAGVRACAPKTEPTTTEASA